MISTPARPGLHRRAALALALLLGGCAGSDGITPPPTEVPDTTTARPAQPTFAMVTVGNTGACALTDAGDAYCWGRALGDTVDLPGPERVMSGVKLQQIARGNAYACALTVDREVFCWGVDLSNGLGVPAAARIPLGDATRVLTPTRVPGLPPIQAISAGSYATCALATDGRLFCWGDLPDPTGRNMGAAGTAPQALGGDLRFRSISLRGRHLCGIATTGTAYCWGWDVGGEAGATGSREDLVFTPRAVQGVDVASAVAGQRMSCVISTAGQGHCWGHNVAGKLGSGVAADPPEPTTAPFVKHTPTPLPGGLTFSSIDPGMGETACGVITSGRVYCWGVNGFGQAGIDPASSARCAYLSFSGIASTPCNPAPRPMTDSTLFLDVQVGFFMACGRTTQRFVMCWGGNQGNGLGAPGPSSPGPVRVVFPI